MTQKLYRVIVYFTFMLIPLFGGAFDSFSQKRMMYGDTTRIGRPFSKDPHVVKFKGNYLLYYSIPPAEGGKGVPEGWAIGIAQSKDLTDWKRIGEITPQAAYEAKGLCAPGALVRNDTVHLFYQTYGNGPKDAICHAWSVDGINFTRNATNPIFSPTGDWNCGRAIDAEVTFFNNTYFLYFATRTPDYQIQIQGVATAPASTNFNKEHWTQACDKAILEPTYPWEGKCVEGASIVQKGDKLFMFYAGAYNNNPQQIGIAKSSDGITWEKLSNKPFLPNGDNGTWNYCESGHPHIFKDPDTERTYLFFQGNNDFGKTWFISQQEVFWTDGEPAL
jgi:predicted GH43/DUF377 family glycosyl hydrolase